MTLFDESTLRKLEQLALVAERVRVGVMKGDRRSSKRGTSIEFADYRNYATCLIAIDPEELEAWEDQTGSSGGPESDAVRDAVQAHVDEVNEKLARYETIKYFRIIPALTVEDGLLTASLKVKRSVVYERYEDTIDDMYESAKKAAS